LLEEGAHKVCISLWFSAVSFSICAVAIIQRSWSWVALLAISIAVAIGLCVCYRCFPNASCTFFSTHKRNAKQQQQQQPAHRVVCAEP
jgi:hypothetical protein